MRRRDVLTLFRHWKTPDSMEVLAYDLIGCLLPIQPSC